MPMKILERLSVPGRRGLVNRIVKEWLTFKEPPCCRIGARWEDAAHEIRAR